jgi:hypothetical protein
VKLRDVLFLTHAKPKTGRRGYTKDARKAKSEVALTEAEVVFQQLVDDTLPTPNTWETRLSACKSDAEKREVWVDLLQTRKLGALALIRNLRNMVGVSVPDALISEGLTNMQADRVLPYRFLTAARYAPRFVSELEAAMFRNLGDAEKLPGTTVVLVDVSGSMDAELSAKSEMLRWEAAAGLAVMGRELFEKTLVFTFSSNLVEVPAYRGFGLVEAIKTSQMHGSTHLGAALTALNSRWAFDRIVVVTDEQSHDRVPGPKGRGYMINVAPYQHGVGYGPWVHMDGFSEATLQYIAEFERLPR